MLEDVSIEEECLLCCVLLIVPSPSWQAPVDVLATNLVLMLLRLLDTWMTPHDQYGDMFCFSSQRTRLS